MSLQISKEVVSEGVPIFQKVLETARGGLTLDNTGLTAGKTIPGGTPALYDEGTRMVKVLKTAEIIEVAGSSATTYKVKPGSLLSVGDYIGKTVGGAAYAITAVAPSGSDYDAVTVGTTLGAMVVGDSLFQSSATGASAAALNITPNGLTYEDYGVEVDKDISVVIRGTVYARRVPAAPSDVKSALPLIIYSQSR